jgi:predicted PurR-regulated permease PerM
MHRPSGSTIALLLVTAIAVYLCWLMIEPFVSVLLWAAVLAIISYPYFLKLRDRRLGKSVAAMVTTAVVVLVVILPLTLLALALVRQAVPAAETLESNIRHLLDHESKWFQFVDRYFDLDQLRDPEYIKDRMRGATSAIASRTLGIVGGALGVVWQIFFVLFTLYYLLRDADYVSNAVRGMLPLRHDEADEVFRRTHDVISASIYGVLVIAAVQGVLGGLAFLLLGIPSPLLWGMVMFLMSMIPMVGSFIVWAPAAVFLAVQGHWGKAIFLVVWGAGLIGTVDNILRPKLVGERARLHELTVFFSVLGGLHVFGVLGLVIGPVVVAVTLSLIDVMRRVNQRTTDTHPPTIVIETPAPPPQPVEVAVTVVEVPPGGDREKRHAP